MFQRWPSGSRHENTRLDGRRPPNRAEFPSRPVDGLGWTQQPPSFTPTSMPSMHRKPHCKALLRTMGNVMSRRVKSQWANPIHEPRKLRSSVFSIWKHGSNGMSRSDAQTASPLALSVQLRSITCFLSCARLMPAWNGLKERNGEIRQAETEYSKLGIAKIETTSRHFC